MEDYLRNNTKSGAAQTAADMIPTAVDGYLREQDMVNLLRRDLSWSHDGDRVSAHFGRAERGESSKTGREQGVVFECPYVIDILKRRSANLGTKDRVFPIAAATYAKWWRAALRHVLGDPSRGGPPHSARHTGASRDLSTGYRAFEQVQRRGR